MRKIGPINHRIRQAACNREEGKSFIVMLLVILPTLILVLGISFDLGNVATGVTIAQNAADLAALEAGKLIDVDHYATHGEVRLRSIAPIIAQQVADEITGGTFVVTGIYVEGQLVIVQGEVSVHTPFLEMFVGRHSVTRFVEGISVAAYGIEEW